MVSDLAPKRHEGTLTIHSKKLSFTKSQLEVNEGERVAYSYDDAAFVNSFISNCAFKVIYKAY